MNSFSHKRMGKLLLRYMEEQYGIKLERRSFLYGNVKPDFSRFYKSRPHKQRYWENYLIGEIHKLTAHKQSSRSFGPDYSKRLGVICHFYADFFCLAHSSSYDGGSYDHFKYEWVLGRHLRENTATLYQDELSVKSPFLLGAEMIYGDFIQLQNNYIQCSPDYMNDLTFTLRACAGTVSAVTKNSIVTDRKPAIFSGLIPQVTNIF